MSNPYAKFGVELSGLVNFNDRVKAFRKVFRKELGDILVGEAIYLLRQANAKVPIAAGTLRRSGFVGKPFFRRTTAGIRLGYEDPKAPAVHEGIHWGKKLNTPRKKWFEQEAQAYATGFKARMRQHMAKLIAQAADNHK